MVVVVVVGNPHPRTSGQVVTAPEVAQTEAAVPARSAADLVVRTVKFCRNRDTAGIVVSPLSHREADSRGGRPTRSLDSSGPGGLMAHSQLMDAPTATTRPTTDAPVRRTHPLEHPRGRGFSVVSRLAREVETPTEPPRHRREEPLLALSDRTG